LNDYYRDKTGIPKWIKNALAHAEIELVTDKPIEETAGNLEA